MTFYNFFLLFDKALNKKKKCRKKRKKKFGQDRDSNPRPLRSVRQHIFLKKLPQKCIILTAYEVNFNHKYL